MVRKTRRVMGGLAATLAVGLCGIGLVYPLAQGVTAFSSAKPGWLYVVASDFKASAGQISVVDPDAGRVVGAITLSGQYQPDLAISPDGRHLYLSYQYEKGGQEHGIMEVRDASSGAVEYHADDPDPWPTNGMAYGSKMALSRDGMWLYRFKASQSSITGGGYVTIFDTASNAPLPGVADLPLCSPATLLTGPTREQLNVVCSHSQDVRTITYDATGTPVSTKPLVSLAVGRGRHGEQLSPFVMTDGQDLSVIKGDGRALKISLAEGRVLEREPIDRTGRNLPTPPSPPVRNTRPRQTQAAANPADWLTNSLIWRQGPVVSPDDSRVYLLVGIGHDDHASGRQNQVMVLDPQSLDRVGTIPLSRPCVSLTISKDGRWLYAVDELRSSLLVIDANSGKEVREITGVGSRPVFALVAP